MEVHGILCQSEARVIFEVASPTSTCRATAPKALTTALPFLVQNPLGAPVLDFHTTKMNLETRDTLCTMIRYIFALVVDSGITVLRKISKKKIRGGKSSVASTKSKISST